ncbi:hypothetical protein AXG93_4804s1190 [Marchantia polymorpha subsp. ruderalis]|uniref:Uncharacterized protein n=1 Tax=Marchantia polymorpha subsp. ruderalis TaxID=1480154 RepID=A0A176VM57_MARPO|nr:hypothetical protein AXG93_4804s1190 [Marchantia polymorpha subsp. ruderalis]
MASRQVYHLDTQVLWVCQDLGDTNANAVRIRISLSPSRELEEATCPFNFFTRQFFNRVHSTIQCCTTALARSPRSTAAAAAAAALGHGAELCFLFRWREESSARVESMALTRSGSELLEGLLLTSKEVAVHCAANGFCYSDDVQQTAVECVSQLIFLFVSLA